MAQLIFKRGSLANLNNLAIKDGQFIVTTDEGALYVDNGSTRVRLGDFIVVENVAALPSAGANRKAMYYCESENVLARWNGTDWVQINKQPTTAELKVKLGLDAEGEVTAAIAAAKKAGDDAQTAADNLGTYVGTFTHDTAKTVVEYINAKTDGIATSGNLEALGQRVTTVEGKVATIEGDYLKSADKTELEGKIATAQTAADNAQAHSEGVASDLADHEADAVAHITAAEREAWSGKTTMAEVEAKGYLVADDIAGKADASQVATDIADAVKVETDARVAADEAIEAKIGTVTEGKTVVEMIADAQTAATYDDEEVRGLIAQEKTDREGAITGLKTELEGKIDTKVGELVSEDERLAGLINGNTAAIATEKARAEEIEAGLRTDVDAIKGDYLKAADKEDLQTQINTILNNPDTEGVINSINEFTQYIADHGEIAEGFRVDIDANAKAIEDHEALAAQTYETKEDATAKFDEVKELVNAKAVQADWNQNDPEAADYVKNRTHYDNSNVEYVVQDVPLADFTEGGQGSIHYVMDASLESGKTYGVSFNGAVYTGTADSGADMAISGIPHPADSSRTGYVYIQDNTIRMYGLNDIPYDWKNSGLTLSIYSGTMDIKQLDEKFIPDSIARASDVEGVAGRMTTAEGKIDDIQTSIDNLGDLAAKDVVSESDLDTALATKVNAYAQVQTNLDNHMDDTDAHVTTEDKEKWNKAQENAEATAAANLATARDEIAGEIATAKGEAISDAEGKIATAKSEAIADAEGKIATAVDAVKTDASNKDAVVLAEAQKGIAAAKTELQGAIDTHVNNADIHVTADDKAKWNAAQANAEKTANDALIEALTWGEF